jgi:arylsulfatase A-like enzyme
VNWLLRRALPAAAAALLLAALGLVAVHAPLFDGRAPERIDRERAERGALAPRRVLLVSIDGLAPRVRAATPTPVLDRLAGEGAVAREARTVVPSITMTAHATMLTGRGPEAHGVTWNRYQPWSRVERDTLYTHCRRAGLRCALFAGKAKFAHFAEGEPGVERYVRGADAGAVLRAAAAWLRERDGDFALVHLAEVDWAGHAEGWDSDAQRRALERLDAALGSFLAEARAASARPLAVLVTSDHGGHGTRHGSDAPEDVDIPWILWGDGVPAGASLGEGVTALDTAPTVLALLGLPAPPDWPGHARFPPAAARAEPAHRTAAGPAGPEGGLRP